MFALLLLLLLPAYAKNAAFLSIGDWGGADLLEGTYAKNTYAVAAQLAKSAEELSAQFIVSTGDNFYWCGIQNVSDFQVEVSWLNPYKAASLQVPWYGSLGNHEYGYNVTAQLDLTNIYRNWYLPERYYHKRVAVSTDVFISFIVIDSSPCVKEYRSVNPSGWDPCGTEYPMCSISGGDDPFEGECFFHQNIITQDCDAQLEWFKQTLQNVPADDWLVVIGHHAADEMDVADFVTPMQRRTVDLYLNGHAHTLSQYVIDGGGAYITTGAGAMVNVAGDTEHALGGTPALDRTLARSFGQPSSSTNGHSYKTIWNGKVAGFTTHTFSTDFTELTTDYVAYNGTVMHSFTVARGQGYQPSK